MASLNSLCYIFRFIKFQTLDQELNMTRRTTKPFIPTNAPNYWSLQRQVQDMEEPIPQMKPRYI